MKGIIRLTITIIILAALWQWLQDEITYDNTALRQQAKTLRTADPDDADDLSEWE